MTLKVGDKVRIADFTHLHVPKAFHGKLEVVQAMDGAGLVGVSPLPSKKKATSFHVDDKFMDDVEWLDAEILEPA